MRTSTQTNMHTHTDTHTCSVLHYSWNNISVEFNEVVKENKKEGRRGRRVGQISASSYNS